MYQVSRTQFLAYILIERSNGRDVICDASFLLRESHVRSYKDLVGKFNVNPLRTRWLHVKFYRLYMSIQDQLFKFWNEILITMQRSNEYRVVSDERRESFAIIVSLEWLRNNGMPLLFLKGFVKFNRDEVIHSPFCATLQYRSARVKKEEKNARAFARAA